MTQAVHQTDFPELSLLKRGKVRDVYDLGDSLLMVASDRLSAFDVILPDPIPEKGKILTHISNFWFKAVESLVPNHLIATDVAEFPAVCQPYTDILADRSVVVKKCEPVMIECVVRGYISGSGWKSYQQSGSVCGIQLPTGLKESDRLPEPIFTPSTKAEQGAHDENIDIEAAGEIVGHDLAHRVAELSLAIYQKGVDLAATKGIIIADTKFEFGMVAGDLILIDEVLTPDSSRFWPQASYAPGEAQKSYDKQYLRDYLQTLDWDKKAPAPRLPQEVILNTRAKYLDALIQLTGSSCGL